MTYRVAIVGAGVWAQNHLAGWRGLTDARVTWVVRSTIEGARATAERWNVENHGADWRAVASRDDIDIVDVLLPHDLHAEAVCFALERGKHVVVEKPLAPTLRDAQRIVDTARRTGRRVMISENWIYSTFVRKAKAAIEAGEIGKPFMLRTVLEMDVRAGFKGLAWRHDPKRMGGGALMDGGTHNISVCRHLLGEIESVAAAQGSFVFTDFAPLEDAIVVLMRFASGALGTLSIAWGAQRERPRSAFTILGSAGTIEFDTHQRSFFLSRDGKRSETVDLNASRGFVEQMRHFLDCLETGREPTTSPDEQIGSLRVILAAYRSANTGAFTRIDSVSG